MIKVENIAVEEGKKVNSGKLLLMIWEDREELITGRNKQKTVYWKERTSITEQTLVWTMGEDDKRKLFVLNDLSPS